MNTIETTHVVCHGRWIESPPETIEIVALNGKRITVVSVTRTFEPILVEA
ncbi:MAG: hypothetical protein ACYCXT_08130 [Acidiferrobacteraceae bacterium]